jgi:lysophospholipase L1-like esterase
MQRDLARKYGLVFFDLFNGMGGAGSMVAMASHKPALASKDYTHLTFDGGRLISNLLLDVLLKEQASYRRKYPLL